MASDGKVSTISLELNPVDHPLYDDDQNGRTYGPTELRRRLSERHVNMIAFSATIGIGLFLQSGKVIYLIGPGGAVIAYLIMATILWSALASLGEMTAIFPVKGPIIDFPSRFIDESVGFAVGWMAWFAFIIVVATEITAIAQLFNFEFSESYLQAVGYPESSLKWQFGQDTSPSVWAGIFLLILLLFNLLPVRVYGEIEYILGCIKITVICGMILFNFIVNLRNTNNGNVDSRFQYYKSPYGFFSANTTVGSGDEKYVYTGATGHLVGMWSAMGTIFFSLQGFFAVAITAAENKDLERDESIKLATRKISLRVILLYTLFVFTAGLNIPYDDQNLSDYSINSIRRGQYSAIMIGCVRSHITGWPHFFNAFFIFSACTTGVNALYISSRLLHALANIQNVWPRIGWVYSIKARLERTTQKGVPAAAIFVSWLFGLLGFLASKPFPAKILGRMAINSSASMQVVYACICLAFISFKTRTINGDPDESVTVVTNEGVFLNRNARDYPYKSHVQWVRAAYAFCACVLLALFNGWRAFLHPFSVPDFVASYISILIFTVLIIAYHIKDEREWNPFRWTRRITMDIDNPIATREKNVRMRKGRLHRANRKKFFCRENGKRILQFIWTWLK